MLIPEQNQKGAKPTSEPRVLGRHDSFRLDDLDTGYVVPDKKNPFAHMTPEKRKIAEDLLRKELDLRAQKTAQQKTQAIEVLKLVQQETERRRLTGDLRLFIDEAWKIIEPVQPLVWNWHLDVLADVLMGVYATPNTRGVINVPPGTMKSILLIMFRAWAWAKNPALRFFNGSYSAHLTIRDNVKLRTIITSEWYKQLFPNVVLTDDVNKKERFDTTSGGWSIATSVGGMGTGEHPDFIFIDDPLTALQARSKAERDSANEWIDGTLSSRGLVRDVRVLLVMQRLHKEDPSGHVLAKGSWWHIRFPMRFETTRRDEAGNVIQEPDPLDQRTYEGELLMPQLYPEYKVRQLEIDLNPYGAAGQLQQRPSPEGGGLFKREWLETVDRVPKGIKEQRIRGWDTAATQGAGDWTAGVKIAEIDGKFYIEDVVMAQLAPGGVDSLILNTARMDGKRCKQREEKEPGASGLAVINARRQLLRGYDYDGVQISKDKVTRANPFRGQCESRNVFLVRGPWNERYLQFLADFPTGEDHVIDASSCAYNSHVDVKGRVITSATWGRKKAS